VIDNHRSNDFANYVYATTDFGTTWRRIDAGLPANRVTRTVREDARNPKLLYLATEFGVFISPDAGGQWVPLRNNMPMMPFNDITIQTRDNTLVLGSHARGLWILDQLNALQELTPAVAASNAHLFTMRPTMQIRTTNLRPHTGDMIFRGENPANGAIIDYWVREAGTAIELTVIDGAGRAVQTLKPTTVRGVNRIVWNLRYADLSIRSGGGEDDDAGPSATTPGPLVLPGTYTVRLSVNGAVQQQRVLVKDDPRVTVSRAERAAWTAFHRAIAALATSHAATAEKWRAKTGTDATTRDGKRQAAELSARISGLYGAVARYTGAPTSDQRSELRYYTRMAAALAESGR